MTSKTGSILVLVVVVLVLAVLPAAAAGSEANVKMSASELNAACAAGGGHIAVSHSLLIKGGTATLTGECDITPSRGAKVMILAARIDATHGDFDICFTPACGNDANVMIIRSTITACAACGLQIYAPGAGAKIKIMMSRLTSNPAGGGGTIGGFPARGTTVISEGKVKVMKTTFLVDTSPVIHASRRCFAKKNTPSTAMCS